MDEFIDVVEGNRVYIKCLYAYNKIDTLCIEELDELATEPNSVLISCNLGINLENLVDRIWEHLALVRVYTKRRGRKKKLFFKNNKSIAITYIIMGCFLLFS